MRVSTRITFFDDDQEKYFGEGPCRLLRAVEETGSLRLAAHSMGMAYSKAMKLLHNAEAALGFPFTVRSIGGKAGGGSVLTEEGLAWLEKYEAYRDACVAANQSLYARFFGESAEVANSGCVVMASGLGTRFGGNKLMADFRGKPMVGWILDATEGLFRKRVVVTRSREVEAYCMGREIPVVFHEQPCRSDTVRLGLREMPEDIRGCLFCPGDQPFLSVFTLKKLLASAAEDGEAIWRPAFEEIPASPVWFPQKLFRELEQLPEGKGGSVIVEKYAELVKTISVEDARELLDIDTRETYEALNR